MVKSGYNKNDLMKVIHYAVIRYQFMKGKMKAATIEVLEENERVLGSKTGRTVHDSIL